MKPKASSVDDYLAALPAGQRADLETVLAVVRGNLNPGFEEGIQYGMIGWYVPHSLFPAGYHCDPKQPLPFAALGSQKNHMSLYLGCLYLDESALASFQEEWAATGKRLDMGKSCVRFRRVADLALQAIGAAFSRITVEQYIEDYTRVRNERAPRPARKRAVKAPPEVKAKAPAPEKSGTKTKRSAPAKSK